MFTCCSKFSQSARFIMIQIIYVICYDVLKLCLNKFKLQQTSVARCAVYRAYVCTRTLMITEKSHICIVVKGRKRSFTYKLKMADSFITRAGPEMLVFIY